MYSLEGIDGNAFSVIGYTGKALKEVGQQELVSKMYKEATESDYDNLISVCMKYIDIANEEGGYNCAIH